MLLCKLYIHELHEIYFHANRNFIRTMSVNQYWLVGGANSIIRRVIHDCLIYTKAKAPTATQVLSQLPKGRVIANPPFSIIGVDFCRPSNTKCICHRSIIKFRSYLLVIVYFTTCTIHLELTTNQTCDDFLRSFNRFISRRGQPSCIYSYNAKTFICATEYLIKFSIDWRFLSSRGPHHGGFWEAAID